MKTLLLISVLCCGMSAQAADTSCSAKKNIATEYVEWKKDYQKFLNTFDGLSSSERFDTSKDAIRTVLDRMKEFSDATLIPLPQTTFKQARALLKEVDAGRMARMTAIPILKSSLKRLEVSMEDMLAKAQWKNPNCNMTPKVKFTSL